MLLLNLSSEVLHRACGIKHNNLSEAVHLLGVSEACARMVLSDSWYERVCLFPKELFMKFCSTSYCTGERGVSSQPLRDPEGKQDKATAALPTLPFVCFFFFFLFKIWFSDSGTEDRVMEREQSRTPHS